jgi:hypothetical protein
MSLILHQIGALTLAAGLAAAGGLAPMASGGAGGCGGGSTPWLDITVTAVNATGGAPIPGVDLTAVVDTSAVLGAHEGQITSDADTTGADGTATLATRAGMGVALGVPWEVITITPPADTFHPVAAVTITWDNLDLIEDDVCTGGFGWADAALSITSPDGSATLDGPAILTAATTNGAASRVHLGITVRLQPTAVPDPTPTEPEPVETTGAVVPDPDPTPVAIEAPAEPEPTVTPQVRFQTDTPSARLEAAIALGALVLAGVGLTLARRRH